MSKTAARVALLCALIGLVVSSAAAYVHYRLVFDPTYRSFCDVSSTITCRQVYLSRYSRVRGIPVASFGPASVSAGAATTLALFPRDAAAVSRAQAAAAPPPSAAQTSEFERVMATAPRVPMAIPTDGAKVLIVDFSDFQCPFCRQAFYAYKPSIQTHE